MVLQPPPPSAEASFYDLLLLHVLEPLRFREAVTQYVAAVEPIFAAPRKMSQLGELGDSKPLLVLYHHCPNKLINYLENNLVNWGGGWWRQLAGVGAGVSCTIPVLTNSSIPASGCWKVPIKLLLKCNI